MRSPSKSVTKRAIDAESELNLPPGFRFHPTDEELIVHYLCRKSSGVAPSPQIIADVDLYKHDPWDLPEMALFGTKEWYFFTPRDRKYPNGSRPNRVTGNGYWKATGADKPIRAKSDPNTTIGIKKALVFYAGKGPKGIKTNWIMHEYRLEMSNPIPSKHTNASVSKLDDWVLCRLYNKKNNPNEKVIQDNHRHEHHPTSPLDELRSSSNNSNHRHEHHHPTSPLDELRSSSNNSNSLNSFEDSDGEFGGNFGGDVVFLHDLPPQTSTGVKGTSEQSTENKMQREEHHDDGNEWLDSLSLEDLHHCLEAMPPNHEFFEIPMFYNSNHQHFFN